MGCFGDDTPLKPQLHCFFQAGFQLAYRPQLATQAYFPHKSHIGVNGLVLIMHGRSDRRATSNAMRVAKQFVDAEVNEHIRSALKSMLSAESTS